MHNISGPVNHKQRPLTRQDYDAWAKAMTACMVAVQADLLLREHARQEPPRFKTARMNKLFDALVVTGYTGPNFTFASTREFADLRDVLFADDLAERWSRGQGITVIRDDDNLFVATRNHLSFGGTMSGLMVPRGFPCRLEAILYSLGAHPDAAVAHYPGAIEHYIAKEEFVAQQRAYPPKVPLAAPEHVSIQVPQDPNEAINPTGVARLFEAMKSVCKDAGVTEPEILKAIDDGIAFGNNIAGDLKNIAEKMRKWPSIDPRYLELLKAKVYPRLNKEMQAQMTELFGSIEAGFDPYGGGLPPGAGFDATEDGTDWPKPPRD